MDRLRRFLTLQLLSWRQLFRRTPKALETFDHDPVTAPQCPRALRLV